MATLPLRLALAATLTLLGSGCTLHVVSGPVSHRQADNDTYYAMTPARARVLRPAPRQRPRPTSTSEGRQASGSRPSGAARDEGSVPYSDVARSGRDDATGSAISGNGKRHSLADQQRLPKLTQRAKDSKRPDSKPPSKDDGADDTSRDVRFPYWVSEADERTKLEGPPVKGDGRPAESR